MSALGLKLGPPHHFSAHCAPHFYLLNFTRALVNQIDKIQHNTTYQVI